MKELKEPKHLLKFRILSLVLTIIAVGAIASAIILLVFEMHWGGVFFGLALLCFFASLVLFALGNEAKMARRRAEVDNYVQQLNKEELTDIANTSADISSEAITKTIKAVKKGLKDTKFCKHCGVEIDSDSKFCKDCGKEQ